MALFFALSGTLLNAVTVLIGGTLGTFLGDKLPERIHDSLFGVLGLFTVLIGLLDAITTKNPLILLGALLVGTLIGELGNIEGALNRLGDRVQKALAHEGSTVSEAFVTSSLVFCVGPLSILGPLDNGLNGDITKLAIKATLDGFAALAFSAALGWGVLLSIGVILIYQGAISLSAHAIAPLLNGNPQTITELTAVGGLILVAIGLKLLKIRDLRAGNMCCPRWCWPRRWWSCLRCCRTFHSGEPVEEGRLAWRTRGLMCRCRCATAWFTGRIIRRSASPARCL